PWMSPARESSMWHSTARGGVLGPFHARVNIASTRTLLMNRQQFINEQHTELESLLGIALDLTASLAAADRYNRLLAGVRRLVPCDAACLLRLEGTHLVPVAGFGLTTRALARRYERRDHPR